MMNSNAVAVALAVWSVGAALAGAAADEGVDLGFTAPTAGFYSVVIENEAGVRIRRLLSGEPLAAKQPLPRWDGCDDGGKPVNPGRYHYRGLGHEGIGLRYIMTYNNPGQPPWRIADGTGDWGGDHSPPQAVAANASGVYLGWAAAEDGDGIIGCDFSGRKRWGFYQVPTPSGAGSAFLAVDGRRLFYLSDSLVQAEAGKTQFETAVTCIDTVTGLRTGFSAAGSRGVLERFGPPQVRESWWWNLWLRRAFSLDTHAIHDDYFYTGRCMGGNAGGIAARNGRLYVGLRVSGVIRVFDAEKLTPLAEWAVPRAGGIAFGPDGGLFAISARSVVRIDETTGKASPVISEGLEAPVGLVIGSDGTFYVSDWGAAQCVKVFSARGALLRTIGNPGGRPWLGTYSPAGMLLPRGIALDPKGRLWVAEDDGQPRRVSVWNALTGKFEREFIGGTSYGGINGGVLDPTHPNRAISQGVVFSLDEKTGASHPLSTLWRRTASTAVFGFGPAQGGATVANRFVEKDGRRFFLCDSGGTTVIGEWKGDIWRPCAAVGGVLNRGDNPMVMPVDRLTWRHTIFPEDFRVHAGENFIWTDINGDGCVQPAEMRWSRQTSAFPCLGLLWGSGGLDRRFNLTVGGGPAGSVVTRFEFMGWTSVGAPRYDFSHASVLMRPADAFTSLAVDGNGGFFTVQNAERTESPEPPALRAYNVSGSVSWSWPTTLDFRVPGAINGEGIMGPFESGGAGGEVLALTQWHGRQVPLLTTDGLFLGSLLRDPAAGGAAGPDLYRGETVQYLNRLDDGRLVLSHGKNGHHLFQITGLETVRRFAGDVTVTPALTDAATRDRAHREAEIRQRAPIRISRVAVPPRIDGKLDEWDWSSAAQIGSKSESASGEVALSADETNLYVAFRIRKSGDFINRGTVPSDLFLTGDAVDLQFAADPTADPGRTEPAMGDTRIVISRLANTAPLAMIYRAIVPHAPAPAVFRSPAQETRFDEVRQIDGARVSLASTSDGYVIEAKLPLADIGLGEQFHQSGLWEGRVLAGDAGFILADSTSRRVARIYRYATDTSLVSDVATEAAMKPWQWGILQVDSATATSPRK